MSLRAFLICAALALPALSQGDTATLPGDSVYQLSATLTDADDRAWAWPTLRGQPRIATMFYTSCRYVCPMIVDSIKAVERNLTAAERARIGFVLISMDPAHDDSEALSRVMTERRLDRSSWLLLRPEPANVRAIAGLLGVRYRATADGEFNHTSTLVLLDAEGRVLARTERIGGQGDPEFLAAVRRAVRTDQR